MLIKTDRIILVLRQLKDSICGGRFFMQQRWTIRSRRDGAAYTYKIISIRVTQVMISINHSALFTFLSVSIASWVNVIECYLHVHYFCASDKMRKSKICLRWLCGGWGLFRTLPVLQSPVRMRYRCLPVIKCNAYSIIPSVTMYLYPASRFPLL